MISVAPIISRIFLHDVSLITALIPPKLLIISPIKITHEIEDTIQPIR